MRTPWKLLYDAIDGVMPYNSPTFVFFGGKLWLAFVAVVVTILIKAVSLITNWVAPDSGLAGFLDNHFWATVLAVCGIFFVYWFFRLVWDIVSQPTPPSSGKRTS